MSSLLRNVIAGAGRRRGGGVYDADATAYIAAVETNDGASLETGVKDAYNAFIIDSKADGNWNAMKACCLMLGARTVAGALTPLYGTGPTNYGFVSGDYDREEGLIGNGSSKYLDSNRGNTADPQDNQAFWMAISTAPSTGSLRGHMGIGAGDSGSSNMGQSSAQSFFRSRNSASDTLATGGATGLVGVSRTSSANFQIRSDGSTSTITRTSQTPLSGNFYIYVRNGGAGAFSDGRYYAYGIGEGVYDFGLLETRLAALKAAIAATL